MMVRGIVGDLGARDLITRLHSGHKLTGRISEKDAEDQSSPRPVGADGQLII